MAFAVGAGERGVGRSEDGDDGRADGGGDMHRAAVVGDDDGAMAIKLGELGEVGLTSEIERSGREGRSVERGAENGNDCIDALALGSGAGEHDAAGRQAAQQFGKLVVSPKFGGPTGGRVEGDQ